MVDLIDAVEADAQVAPADAEPSGLGSDRAAPRVPSRASGSHASGAQYAPLLLVAFAVGFGLWMLRPELHVGAVPERRLDARVVRPLRRAAAAGGAQSRSTPGTRTSGSVRRSSCSTRRCRTSSPRLLSIVFGDSTFRWANYLLICTWPISVYIGARLLGLDRWQAGAAALLSPMLVERRRLRLRVGQLRVARQRHVVDAVGALADADRDRAWRGARSRRASGTRSRRSSSASRARSTSSPGYLVLLALGVFVLVRPPAGR